jgi:hypothetical protein
MQLDGQAFDARAFDAEVLQVLRDIPPGRPNATAYHHFVAGLITYIFYPNLITPTLEFDINQGRKRIDIAFANAADRGFFSDMKRDPFLLAREIMVECKNYTEDLANNEIDQMIGRFDPRRGRLGVIACRAIADPNRLLERCRDMFRAQQGAAIVFTDEDFARLLDIPDIQRGAAVDEICREKFRALMA